MMMAEVLPNMHAQMQQDEAHMGALQNWSALPDARDAYIGWLKGEFAAANALIDSMCHHMRSIGGPGEYDLVFSCLNRRRHAWTPSLYLQCFSSVGEVVTALQEVAWKRHQGQRISSLGANVASKACPASCQVRAEEAHDKAQLGNNQRSNCFLDLIDSSTVAELSQQSESVRMEGLSTSRKDVNTTTETGEVEAFHSPNSALSTSAESCIIECDKKSSHTVCKPSFLAHICNSGEQVISANNAKGRMDDQASLFNLKGLDVKKLLKTEILIASKEEDGRHAIIKRSLQFQCCEHVDGQQINDGESVELCEHVFNNKELDEMIEIIDQLQTAGRQGELGCAFRGCKKSTRLPDIIRFGPKIGNETKMNNSPCIPKFLQAISRWLTSCGILSPEKSPDSFLITIFEEGSFEEPNTDQGAWEKPLCVISLMEGCSMVFGHSITTDQYGNCKAPFRVALPAGSVLLLRENFTGILQKAIRASPSRRITIALGKAVSTSSAQVNCVNAAGKIKNKYRGRGGDKQAARLQFQFPFPFLLPPPAVALPRLVVRSSSSSSPGTGVFLPSCTDSVATSWQPAVLLVSSTSLVASVHSKRAGQHTAVKAADSTPTHLHSL